MEQFSVAPVFSDHMVLQRDKIISIFGTSDSKKQKSITVSLFDSQQNLLCCNSTLAENGKWNVRLTPQTAQTGCSMTISCDSIEIKFTDIAIGEVWLAGGQSNMEFELQNCTEGPDELKSPDAGKNIRFYYTNKIAWMDEKFYEAEKNTCWQTWDSPTKGAWSAVAYFFAKKLAADLNCVVGIVGCNWGGTSASAWMRREFLEKDEDLKSYLTEYEEAVAGKSIEQQIKEFDDYEIENAEWQRKYSVLWEQNPGVTWEQAEKTLGKNPWPGPKSCKNPYRPTGLYDCMVSRILPYTLKGVLWYQGESDDHKPQMYYKLFRALIDNWRTDWKDETLPFVFVQLPVHRYEADKDFKHWCLIREAQAKAAATLKNTYLTCAFDLGQYSDIHPKAKKTVGERMELNALANVYNKIPPEKAAAPIFKEYICLQEKDCSGSSEGGKFILSFDNADDGFELRNDDKRLQEYKKMEENQGSTLPSDFTGFEIAGNDGVFYPAQFEFDTPALKKNQIIIYSEKVKNPVMARYGWFNYGPVTIYGKNGIPLCPFRTM